MKHTASNRGVLQNRNTHIGEIAQYFLTKDFRAVHFGPYILQAHQSIPILY